ncbi:MAG: GtrA family protein [Spirosomaceae bacterium]|nr:GtrA family protein [Spirosomataceae bacterium]
MQKLLQYIKTPEFRSFFIFFLTAVFGAGVNFFSQIPYKSVFLNLGFDNHSAYPLSIFFSYLTATVVSFIPQKIFAFSAKASGNTKRETIKYLVIALSGLGIQTIISYLAFNFITKPLLPEMTLTVQEKAGHLIGMGFSFFANFFGHKFLTFRSTGIYNKIKAKNA